MCIQKIDLNKKKKVLFDKKFDLCHNIVCHISYKIDKDVKKYCYSKNKISKYKKGVNIKKIFKN